MGLMLPLEHDPEKWLPVFPRDKREAFARRSCSNKKIERDDDSKKSHPALGQRIPIPGLEDKRKARDQVGSTEVRIPRRSDPGFGLGVKVRARPPRAFDPRSIAPSWRLNPSACRAKT